jgi:maltooligosyltrehalose trehalohydrolase
MAVVLPHGVLFRMGAEGKIRQKLLNMDVIGLGSNLFYGTGLAACILVFRRRKAIDRKNKVLIIDASVDRIPYLVSLGVNAIELLPINSIAEPTQWGYMPIFHFVPEERFGNAESLRRLVNKCHRRGIAVIIDMVYAHTDRMFPYQIGYERFFDLWEDEKYYDESGLHRSPNPLVCSYNNFGQKNDWRMQSTHEFFAAVNAFWLKEYHVDGFRYDHVNGYLDRKPIKHDNNIDWYSQENRPTFVSLQSLSKATYLNSKEYPRFYNGTGPSRIIQIAEDLWESAYQLSPVSNSAINGNWEKRLTVIVQNMLVANNLSNELGRELLLADKRFDEQGYKGKKTVDSDSMPAMVVQFIESHDECRLFYIVQHGCTCPDSGFEYRNGLDDQPWWKLQPYAIALLTSVGIPMLWAGQEFDENTGLASKDQVRVRAYRPLHWDFFYKVSTDPSEKSPVLPLETLYWKLCPLRLNHPALHSPRENAKEEYCNQHEKTLVYRRWQDGEVIVVALNFSDNDSVEIPFGHTGKWVDILEASYEKKEPPYSITVTNAADRYRVPIPGNFGRLMRLS